MNEIITNLTKDKKELQQEITDIYSNYFAVQSNIEESSIFLIFN